MPQLAGRPLRRFQAGGRGNRPERTAHICRVELGPEPGGKYQIVVGFIGEPVFAGDKSGLEFFVSDLSQATPVVGQQAAEGAPVEGLEETLKAEVIFGDQTMELPLSARFNTPGAYESVFFPSQPGDYTFRIYGTLAGTDIDESFTSSPEGFGAVEDPAPLHFPK